MKKIEFILSKGEYSGWAEKPYPAIKLLPEWYKKMEIYHSCPKNEYEKSQNMTIKRCIPFRDFISSGYFINLPCDVEVLPKNNEYFFRWKVDGINLIEPHQPEQTHGIEISKDFDSSCSVKWDNPWTIKTPKGYSTLFISPQMRDLPFYSLPAIVDTDSFNVPVNFPFFIKNNFSGVIKKGTPIIQAIPFKRENWKSTINEESNEVYISNKSFINSKFVRAYKDYFWKRKEFK